jgi:hypothetical protein
MDKLYNPQWDKTPPKRLSEDGEEIQPVKKKQKTTKGSKTQSISEIVLE